VGRENVGEGLPIGSEEAAASVCPQDPEHRDVKVRKQSVPPNNRTAQKLPSMALDAGIRYDDSRTNLCITTKANWVPKRKLGEAAQITEKQCF